jgi:hypothetical protein
MHIAPRVGVLRVFGQRIPPCSTLNREDTTRRPFSGGLGVSPIFHTGVFGQRIPPCSTLNRENTTRRPFSEGLGVSPIFHTGMRRQRIPPRTTAKPFNILVALPSNSDHPSSLLGLPTIRYCPTVL